MNEPTSMWSAPMRWRQPPSWSRPVTVRTLEPMPLISAPISMSMRARSCTWGSQALLPITVVPGVSAAARSAFSVAMTDGSSMNTSQAARPRGASSTMSRSMIDGGAHGAERVEVRVEPAAADDVAARRRHVGAAEAGQQRPGEQEGRAYALGQVAIDRGRSHPGGAQADLVVGAVHPHADVLEQAEHGVDVADPRHVRDDHLLLGEERGSQHGQSRVLVASGDDRAGQGRPALDHELLHKASAGRPGREVGGLGREPS